MELKATTAQEIVRNEKDCDYMDELFGGVKMPPTQVYLKSEVDKVFAELEESHKMEVEQLQMKIAGLEKLVETADKLLKQKDVFTVKDITFNGVNLEGVKDEP